MKGGSRRVMHKREQKRSLGGVVYALHGLKVLQFVVDSPGASSLQVKGSAILAG